MPDGFPGTETLDAANEDVARDSLSRSSPEPTETDRQGHYIGPSSGVSFLLRIQKKLHENRSLSHNSSIFTFGDAPLPDHDDTFFVLPPKADAIRLVERYFDFAAPTHRFLHRPTIENLLDEFFETRGEMLHKEDAAAKKALLLMIFAQAQAYMEPATAGGDNSAQYYFAAERQLAKERGACTLSSVQARLVECYYLLAQSRINQCWSLFGTTAHLALAIGLNRSRRGDSSGKVDYLELECQRRTFWSAYVLDKFLSAALGRPMTLRDPDIDQELPTVINDDDLFSHTMKPTPPTTPSIMRAPVEHIRLSRIVSSVLRDLYPIRPPSMPLRIELAAKYSTQLVEWRSRLSRFLDAEGIDSSLLLPLYQRQRNVLNLAYYHTMLLVHRPFLLSNFASLSNIGARPGQVSNIDTSENITQCLDAALSIVRIVDEIFQSSQIFRAFWFTQYYAFCAVVVIYIYRIQQQHSVDSGKSEEYFAAGQRCQAQLSSLTDTDCLSKRYCLVLEELRLEAARQTTGSPATLRPDVAPMNMDTQNTRPSEPLPNGTPSSSLAVPVPTASNADPNPSTFQSTFYSGAIPPTPESAVFTSTWMGSDGFMEDLTTWGQFDSFVTAGIGVLDGVGTGLGR
ncbi:uncharacterized protein EI97DRAFT_459936 [Westerdykella ornata]|uniref:Xylanolytic transcriptional activator regulatory domain-containing protein n=1 Tax=Westerdykella ornata TaxID=318751 RepID=A0A6A6JGA5_WESOR|nr:uncharacterized protein EI97DRAFT_459936 [Westerdykella ornata]KAF2274656.1 hypothetical protein EI97DRAFT_459936 [Westerdykella ornata]